MEDAIFGILEDSKCPNCKSSKVVCYLQFPMTVKVDMKGHIVRRNSKGKRLKLSNEWKAIIFDKTFRDEYQCANYECEKCGWVSKIYTP